MNGPQRIQRKRTKGWRMPEGTVYVGRPSLWGNPFDVASCVEHGFAVTRDQARAVCAEAFRSWLREGPTSPWWFDNGKERHHHITVRLPELRGHDLACWCPLEDEYGERCPCHADVLLALANPVSALSPSTKNQETPVNPNAIAVQRALRAWAGAIRGDWGSIDGRGCRDELNYLASLLNDDAEPVRWEDACRGAGVCWAERCWPEHCSTVDQFGMDCAHMQRDSFEAALSPSTKPAET